MTDLLSELEAVVAMIDIRRTDGRLRYSYAPDDLAPAAARFFAHHHAEIAAAVRDKRRMDWLESEANKPGGLLLHDGSESGRRGLGLRPGCADRTLREAVDSAMRAGEGE